MRYYYTDPLAAAWMAKHFGMVIASSIYGDGSFEGFVVKDGAQYGMYYIHQDSLRLLDIKLGDVVRTPNAMQRYKEISIIELRDYLNSTKEYTIIQRNGVPFVWPETKPTEALNG